MTDTDRFVLEIDEPLLQRAIEDTLEHQSGWPFSEDRKVCRMLADLVTYEVAHGHQDWIVDTDGIHKECIFREDTGEFTEMLVELLGKIETAQYSINQDVRAFAGGFELDALWERINDLWPQVEHPKIPKQILDVYNAHMTRPQEQPAAPSPPSVPAEDDEDIVISV